MKKLFSLIAVLILLAAMAMLPASASIYDPDAYTMYVRTPDGKNLNLREEPDANAAILAKIPYGVDVLVYSDYVGQWLHVQYGLYNGFVKAQFLSEYRPDPYEPPTPKPTPKPTPRPTPTAPPTPEELIAREIAAARSLGLVPQGMKSEGNCTWQELDGLLTNAIRLKNKNSAAIRNHVYLTLDDYQTSNAGAAFNIVLRGVAAAEMYGALIDMGEYDPASQHANDPYIADAADIDLCQQYAGINAVPDSDWHAIPMLDMVLTILDHVDGASGKPVMSIDLDHDFFATHPITRTEAILGVYRLYHSFHTGIGMVTVTHYRQANIRANPSMKAPIVGKVNPGDVFEVIDIPQNDWYHIQLPNGATAYIAAGVVSFAMN